MTGEPRTALHARPQIGCENGPLDPVRQTSSALQSAFVWQIFRGMQ